MPKNPPPPFPNRRDYQLGHLYVPGVQVAEPIRRPSLLFQALDGSYPPYPTVHHDLGRLIFCDAFPETDGVTFYRLTLTTRTELTLSQYPAAMRRVLEAGFARRGAAAFMPPTHFPKPTPRERTPEPLPGLVLELPPASHDEYEVLQGLAQFIARTQYRGDVRMLRADVKNLLGPGYYVGAGSSHLWIHRLDNSDLGFSKERLGLVFDQLANGGACQHACYATARPWEWTAGTVPLLPATHVRPVLDLLVGTLIYL